MKHQKRTAIYIKNRNKREKAEKMTNRGQKKAMDKVKKEKEKRKERNAETAPPLVC